MDPRPSRFLDWLPFLWARVLFPAPQTAPPPSACRRCCS